MSTTEKCANPECEESVRDRTRAAGYPPKYCSIKCRDRANYLSSRDRALAAAANYRKKYPWAKLKRYGLTMEEAEHAWQRRSFGCAICGSHERLSFDHRHGSGEPRDWLCNSCNAGVGHMGDDPRRLRAAAAYLELHAKRIRRAGG